jgi:hypothetical protein
VGVVTRSPAIAAVLSDPGLSKRGPTEEPSDSVIGDQRTNHQLLWIGSRSKEEAA